eukprot:SAG22_NODE_2070_length_3052_cov_1.855401_5_plen_73_part_00
MLTLMLMRIMPPLTWNYYNLIFEAAQIQNRQMDAWNITVMVDPEHRCVLRAAANACPPFVFSSLCSRFLSCF